MFGYSVPPGGQFMYQTKLLFLLPISHAAIDMVCALMEPMHEDYDLRQEQYNKSSLLSSERFLDGLLDMWTTHVVRILFFNLTLCKCDLVCQENLEEECFKEFKEAVAL